MSEDPAASAQEAVEHLRAAALELIAAARAILDLTEDLVKDPEPLLALAASLTAAARAATTATPESHGADAGPSRVQHIKVS